MSDTLRSLFSGAKPESTGGQKTSGSFASSGGTSGKSDDTTDSKASAQEVMPDIIPSATIKVVGIGGGGSNAVKRMVEMQSQGVEFISVNTDAQALYHNPAATKLNIGRGTTRGLGAGANPDIGKKAMEESTDEVKTALEGLMF